MKYFILLFLFVTQVYTQSNQCIVLMPPGININAEKYQELNNGALTNTAKLILISAHIVRANNGAGGISLADVNTSITQLNTAFANTSIQFQLSGTDYIDNDTYYSLRDDELVDLISINNAYDKMNVYFVPAGEGFNGIAYYLTNGCAVTNSAALNGSTLAHEIGHTLFLIHTHGDHDNFPDSEYELVNGSNCSVGGDFLCDTPAEPYNNRNGISGYVYSNTCGYFGSFKDANNQSYSPQVNNYMGYSPATCKNQFTGQQISKMQQVLNNQMSYLVNLTVFADQVDQTQNRISGSTIGRWNGSIFDQQTISTYPLQYTFYRGVDEAMQADQRLLLTNQKYNNWNLLPDVTNHHVFQSSGSISLISHFQTVYSGVVLNSVLYEASTINGLEIDFKDPWLIDYSDPQYVSIKRNQGLNAPYKTRLSPFNPNYSTPFSGDIYQGVFLNQPYGGSSPAYVLRAPLKQSMTLSQTGRTHNMYLQSWSASGASISTTTAGDIGFYGATYRQENAVNFTSGSATVNANYKTTQLSDLSTTFRNNSQRKVISANGILYNTYESMGSIWLEKSTNNGVSWDFENNGKPLNTRPAKSPSLSTAKGFIFLTYQEQSTTSGYSDIKVVYIYYAYNLYFTTQLVNTFTVSNSSNLDLNPVTAFYYDVITGGNSDGDSPLNITSVSYKPIVTCWEENGNLSVKYGQVSSLTNSQQSVQWSNDQYVINNAKHPAAVARASSFSLVWEHAYSGTSSDIYYLKATVENNGSSQVTGLNIKYLDNISSTSGFIKNYNPSIVSIDTSSRISWLGFRYIQADSRMLEKQDNVKAAAESEYRVVFRDPFYNHYWNFGSQVASPTITRNDAATAYIIGWSENSGQYNRFADNSLSTVRTLNTIGADVQISNAYSTSNMYAVSFKSSATPFYFSTSNSIGSFAKQQSAPVATGREGLVGKNGALTYFAFGDISIDDMPVAFTDISDTVEINTIKTLNDCMTTESFNLRPTSKLLYSVTYGLRDTESIGSIFNDAEQIKYKVELVNKLSGNVIGVFDEVIYNNQTYKNHNSIAWQVSTDDLQQEVEVFLRLKIETNIVPIVSLAEKYSDGATITNSFNKIEPRKMYIKNEGAITSYSLSQNYPNPFNPSTTINYAIPKDGYVSLKIYDAIGREVLTLVNAEQNIGRYEISFDASKLASGVYIYKLTSGKFSQTKKMLLMK